LIEKLLNFLSDNVWSLVSITNISWYLKNQFKQEYSTKTIANYLKYLEFPYIINEVSRYDIKWKKILEYVWKYYFSDVWIKNSYSFIFAKDIWKILENLVYLKLLWEWYKIFVWENNWNEVDFVAEKNWEKIYIQVCYLLSWENVIKREFWNLLKIKDNYRKIVISMDESFWNTYDGVENINIIDFLA
jgi:predicted AAA+ superfamily ATPase